MRSFREGQLVTVVADGEEVDGIVVHAPSLVRVEVAVADQERGAVFRTLHPKLVRTRTTDGEQDEVLRRAIRRTGSGGAGLRGGPAAGRARRGHGHVAGHRTTGK
ncbi:MAG TPA: hypothetical protein VN213_21745 [Solirubrobacteraceae bacterium]|nr:hypothetical protein [Solirubrobacteraceae bacterium]